MSACTLHHDFGGEKVCIQIDGPSAFGSGTTNGTGNPNANARHVRDERRGPNVSDSPLSNWISMRNHD
jgi:hypothetical protein